MSHDPAPERIGVAARLPLIALYVVLGLLVGVIGSFTHRARFDVGQLTVWYGMVLSLACVLAFALGLRSANDRSAGYAYAAGIVIAVFGFSLGLGGSVVIVGDLVGQLWLVAAPMIAVLAVFWPRLPRRRAARPDATAQAPGEQAAVTPQGYPGRSSAASSPEEPLS